MWFLVKITVTFGFVLLLLPIEPENSLDQSDRVGPLQAVYAVREAWRDTAGMCERRPDVCETGLAAVKVIAIRAREGAKMAYEYLDAQLESADRSDVRESAEQDS